MLFGHRQGLLAVARLQEIVAVHREPRPEDVAVCLVVIDDEDARRIVHGGKRDPR